MKKIFTTINNICFAFKYIFKIKSSYIYLLFLSTILTALDLIYSIIMLKIILDSLIKRDPISFVWITILVFSISFLLDSIIKYIDNKLLILNKIIIEQKANLDIFQSVSELDLISYDQTECYDNIFFNLSEGYENLISLLQNFSLLLSRILSVFGIVSIIGNYNLSVLIIILIFVIINSLLNIINAKLCFKKTLALIPSLRGQDYVRRIFYLKQYASEIRVFDLMNFFMVKYKKYTENRYEITKKYINLEFVLFSIQVILQLVMQATIIIILAYNYFNKKIKISDFLIIYNSILDLNDYFSSVVNTFPDFYKNSLYISEFRELIDKGINNHKNLRINNLELRNISFKYNEDKYVIEDLSISFKSGYTYVITGNNGKGKSTLLKIIAGLYEQSSGEIFLNGILLKDKKILTNSSSVKFQDHQFYAATIAENILTRACNKEDEEIIWNLLKDVGLYHKVKQLPLGIHTVLTQEFDEAGTTFSGGEVERLTIARTLLNKKSIMIFDEPTSALDSESVKSIQELIINKCKNNILIYVTHDLTDLNKFDYIVDLSKI